MMTLESRRVDDGSLCVVRLQLLGRVVEINLHLYEFRGTTPDMRAGEPARPEWSSNTLRADFSVFPGVPE
jgi:hypothetical protein